MDNILQQVIQYFQHPTNYFWRWADKGQVIEWKNGATLCYREELVEVMKALAPTGLPPLGSILLAMAAAKDTWRQDAETIATLEQTINSLSVMYPTIVNGLATREILKHATGYMDMISHLDKAQRSGSQLAMAITAIFQETTQKKTPEVSARMLEEFNSGRLDRYIFKGSLEHGANAIGKDLEAFNTAMDRFYSFNELALAVRIGIRHTPQPADIDIPEPFSADLLGQLMADPRTAGLARLAQHIVAALHLPMHTRESSDQLFGGVSDISNRGNFDRLLLSELAYDDTTLLARLANNEALYLRREAVPDDPPMQRYILIDTTLKIWGTPRVFAMAVALACSMQAKKGIETQAFTLGGSMFLAADLATKEGVIEALEQQDAALQCTMAFCDLVQGPAIDTNGEFMLITTAGELHNTRLLQTLAAQTGLSLLLTVDRAGGLQVYRFVNGHRKLLTSVNLDIAELIKERKRPAAPHKVPDKLPAMFYADPFPLYYPASKVQYEEAFLKRVGETGALAITQDQRVLYWANKERGAQELLDVLEEGSYYWGSPNSSKGFLLVRPKVGDGLWLFQFYFDNQHSVVKKIHVALPGYPWLDIQYHERGFQVKTRYNLYFVDSDNGSVQDNTETGSFHTKPVTFPDISSLRRIVNNGYNALSRVREVYINQDNALSIDGRQLRMVNSSVMKLLLNKTDTRPSKLPVNTEGEELVPFDHCSYRLFRFRWHNGSCIYVDTRGFLHLQSTHPNIPDITILMIIEKGTACWAADGKVCGNPYFTGNAGDGLVAINDFYKHYIQRFIDHL